MIARIGSAVYILSLVLVGFIVLNGFAACLQTQKYGPIHETILIYCVYALLIWLPGRGIKFILSGK